MSETLVQLAFEMIALIILIIASMMTTLQAIKEKNRIDLVIIILLDAVILMSVLKIQEIMNLGLPFQIGYNLNLQTIGILIYLCILLVLILYIKGASKYYTLPLVICVYTAILLIKFRGGLVIDGLAIGIGTLSFIVLIIEGIRNRNGIPIGVASLTLFIGVAQVLEIFSREYNILASILKIAGTIILLLGTSGFINNYILVDKVQEEKIKNFWISKMVVKEKSMKGVD